MDPAGPAPRPPTEGGEASPLRTTPPREADTSCSAYPREFLDRLEGLRRFVYQAAFYALGNSDLAEDVAQEALTRVLRRLLQEPVCVNDLNAFACGVANHIITDFQRRESRRANFDEARVPRNSVEDVVSHPTPSPQTEVLSRLVVQEMERLPDAEREVLRDCFFEGLSCAELSRRTAEPASRLRKRKSRAIRRLSQQVRRRPEISALRDWDQH
ncbi:RNA polymerase sigma factor [Gemmatimonadota bacterium]